MRIYLIEKEFFTFRGTSSAHLPILGESICVRMKKALPVCKAESSEKKGIYLYPVYPFITLDALLSFVNSLQGSFSFEGGYVLREGDCGVLPFVSAQDRFGKGVFTLSDYQIAQSVARKRRNERLLSEGVLVAESAWIDVRSSVGEGTVIGENVRIEGKCEVGKNVDIGDNCVLSDCKIGDNTQLRYSMLSQTTVGKNSTVGPYAYLRPNVHVGDNCRVGDFVEIKSATIGNKSKISHLAYVGDATLGERVNVGCGVVFANYNGKIKQRSTVGDGCFLGSNCNLIAPVTLKNGVFLAAGTTLTQDLNENDFCIGRCRATVKEGKGKKYLS